MKLKKSLLRVWQLVKAILIFIVVIVILRVIVDLVAITIEINTVLEVDSLPSNDGNLYKVWGSMHSDFISHHLFIKDFNIPIDTIAYLNLLGTCLVYMDTVPLWNVKPLPVKKITILKSLDGFVEMRGYDHQDWQEIGNNEIVVIQRKEDSIIETRYKAGNEWQYVNYNAFKNSQGNYTFKNIK